MRNSRTITFFAPKCAKSSLFCALLIFAQSCCTKINGARKLRRVRYQSRNKIAHITNASRRVRIGKDLCSKSSNVCMKPTSYCRTVETMVTVCSKFIITRNESAKISNKCFKMLHHTNTWSNSVTTQMLLLMTLFHTVSFYVYIILNLIVLVFSH